MALEVQAWDEDVRNSDDHIGSLILRTGEAFGEDTGVAGALDRWHTLRDKLDKFHPDKSKLTGELRVARPAAVSRLGLW